MKKLNYPIYALMIILTGLSLFMFQACNPEEDKPPTSILIQDGDGNIYTTVKIGTQTWLKQNLRTTKYNDKTPIPNVTDPKSWDYTMTTPAYCWYNNNATTYNTNMYGALYNWFVVDPASNGNRNVCPAGYHVPDTADWGILIRYLGGKDVAGGKMKEAGTTNWKSPNTGATNSSDFTALPAGMVSSYFNFSNLNESNFIHSTSEASDAQSYSITMTYSAQFIGLGSLAKVVGSSIRCIKDERQISITDASITEGNGTGADSISFTVSLSKAAPAAVYVDYATADSTATTANSDYVAKSGTLIFKAGELSKTVKIAVNHDDVYEPNEVFQVVLSNLIGDAFMGKSKGIGTITNDEPAPQYNISINDVNQNEGNGGGNTTYSFTVSLNKASTAAISVNYTTADSTATTANTDYTAKNGAITFNAGETSKTVDIIVKADDVYEADELFLVKLSNITGTASFVKNKGIGKILNDDAVPKSNISINDVSKNEGNGTGTVTYTFTVSLDKSSSSTISVDYKTTDGTATTANNDYTSKTATLTFTAGQTSQTIDITVNSDDTYEPDELFYIDLSNVTGNGLITDNQAKGTIVNDDAAGIQDGDGNIYTTVVIGTQTWLKENMRTTRYNNGNVIKKVTDNTAWSQLSTPAYSWYNNDSVAFKTDKYGALYNWYVVDQTSNGNRNICPVGYHVPTDAEWTTLTTTLGGGSVAGGKLKEAGFDHWTIPNTGADNSSGFTALGGGGRVGYDGTYYNLTDDGYWWSSTTNISDNTMAWARWLRYNTTNAARQDWVKRFGYAVRCLKD